MYKIEFTGESIEELRAKVKDLTMLFFPLPSTFSSDTEKSVNPTTVVPIDEVKIIHVNPASEKPGIDRDDVKKRIAEIVKVKGNTKLKAILDEFGAAKVKDVPDEKLAELLQRMEAA